MEDGKKVEGKATSLWVDTTPETNYPKLEEDLKTEVLVIGGGIAGLTTAVLLAKEGVGVTVIDSGHIAEGTTGYTTAKVTSAHGLIYKYLLEKFGFEKAKIYADANEEAIKQTIKLADENQIYCDITEIPAYTYSISEDVKNIEEEVWAAKRLGLPVSFTTDLPLPYKVHGAIKYDNQALFHPRKYLLGLARVLIEKGGKIFENSAAKNIEETDEGVHVEVNGRKVLAGRVVIASNFPIYDPNLFFARLTTRQSYTLAVKLNNPASQGMFYSTEDSFHSMRPHPNSPNGELFLIGGELHKTGKTDSPTENYLKLIEWAKENFDVKSVEYHWTTSDTESYDRVPMIGKLTPKTERLYVATGFKGWGMTHGMVAGMLLRDQLLGRKNDWGILYNPSRFESYVSGKMVAENVKTVKDLVKGKLTKPKGEEIENGEGTVIDENNEKVAVYKDNEGNTHKMSAVCTHMGCIVGWNGEEKTWDCPCHGSRFDKNGKVIHGPAVKDLPRS